MAVWFGGNEYNLLATLAKYSINKDSDLELVQQPLDMNLLLNKEVNSAAAMTYKNELYQVLSAGRAIEELNIIDYNKEGTAMPEDGIFVSEEWLNADAKNKRTSPRASCAPRSRAGPTAATTPRVPWTTCSRTGLGRRDDQGGPEVADGRGEQAGLGRPNQQGHQNRLP